MKQLKLFLPEIKWPWSDEQVGLHAFVDPMQQNQIFLQVCYIQNDLYLGINNGMRKALF